MLPGLAMRGIYWPTTRGAEFGEPRDTRRRSLPPPAHGIAESAQAWSLCATKKHSGTLER
jgi:hypothetical protein